MNEMECFRCGKLPRGADGADLEWCICSRSQKNAHYKSVSRSMQLAAGSRCSYGRLDIIREAMKRKTIKDIHRSRFDKLFPAKMIDSGIVAAKLKAGEGKVFLKKGKKKLTKMGGVKNDIR